MKIVTNIARVLVGLLFIFSGFIKANDAVGFSYKLVEYFEVFGTHFFIPIALPLAIFICVFEIVLGVTLLIGARIKLTLWLLLLMIVFFCYLLYVDLFDLILTNEDDQLKFFFTSLPSYLSYGALLCISFILLLNNNSFIAVVYKLIIFYFLIILTGRGPLLTLILILIFNYLLRNKNFNFIKYLKYLFVFVLVAAVYVYFEFEFFDFERFNVFSNYKSDESVSSRFIYIQKCLDGFLDSPIFGNGIGSTGLLISGNDTVLYPHNLFVEVLSECGLIGFILYLSIFVFSIVIIYAKKIPFEYFPILLVVLFIFIQDMKSGAFEAWRISCGLLSIATIFLNYNFMPKDSFSDNQVNKRIGDNCE